VQGAADHAVRGVVFVAGDASNPRRNNGGVQVPREIEHGKGPMDVFVDFRRIRKATHVSADGRGRQAEGTQGGAQLGTAALAKGAGIEFGAYNRELNAVYAK